MGEEDGLREADLEIAKLKSSFMQEKTLAVAAATEDDEAVRICNKLIANGAIAAGITGSGPAISVVSFIQDSETIRKVLYNSGYETIETNFIDNNSLELI